MRLIAVLLTAAGLVLSACESLTPGLGGSPARAGLAQAQAQIQAQARRPLVAAANPLAVEAGMAVLRQGGSAVDAAVAVQAVLGLVEPQSSGLGGGAFMMVYEARTGEVTSFDGRETAPAAATPDLFLENGQPLPFAQAVLSGRSTGAPGAVHMLGLAHQQHGRLAWGQLFGEAERLARDGFVVSPRLAGMINGRFPQAQTPAATAYFSRPDGSRLQAGDTLKNPAYADTVAEIARRGPDALRSGPIADAILRAVGAEPRPGLLAAADLQAYRPIERGALCRPYRIYVVCVPPPPSSGVAVLQLLGMAEATPDILKGAEAPESWVAFGRLQKLMYADRDRYVADPAFVGVPVQGLLDPGYVRGRAALAPGLTGAAEAGSPPGGVFTGADATREPAGTSHFVVVDADGNAVSMTTTVESVFGSGRMAAGFFLNNQLTDFSLTPDAEGRPVANAVAAGKRPRSSMSPIIVLDRQGRFLGAFGSPGGNAILAYNAKALIAVLDWGLPVERAFALPNLVVRGTSVGADTDRFSAPIRDALAAAGMPLQPNGSETSGLHGAIWRNGRWDAGADDRREGVARW